MAKTGLKNCFVSVNGNDISNQVSSVTIETTRPEVDVTAMGDTNTNQLPGIGDATITLEVFNDYTAAALDSIMFPLSTGTTGFAVEIRPNNAARSTSNPAYLLTAILYNYSPIAGQVGAAATTTLTLRNAAQAGLTRATS